MRKCISFKHQRFLHHFLIFFCLFPRAEWRLSDLWLQRPKSVILWFLQSPHSKPGAGPGTGRPLPDPQRQQPLSRGRCYQSIQFKHWYTRKYNTVKVLQFIEKVLEMSLKMTTLFVSNSSIAVNHCWADLYWLKFQYSYINDHTQHHHWVWSDCIQLHIWPHKWYSFALYCRREQH